MAAPIRVMIVDDELLVRAALKVFFEASDEFEVVGEATNGAEALEVADRVQPDVVLMDVQMPTMNGVDATEELLRRQPSAKVVALTTFSTDTVVVPALQAGASGFLVKDTDPERIIDATRLVHEGGYVLSPAVARRLVSAAQEPDRVEPATLTAEEELTERELCVVQLLARGMSNAEIAAEMFVSEATVKSHLGRITSKWGVRDRVQVLIHAARARVVEIE